MKSFKQFIKEKYIKPIKPEVGDSINAFGRGAFNSATMDLGKYGRAGAEYGVKKLLGRDTTYQQELDQEKEKDTTAQTNNPTAYNAGGYTADAAAIVTGVGGLVKGGMKVAANQAAKKYFSDTHSIIDGLNRAKNVELNKGSSIWTKEIDKSKLTPLSPERAKEFDVLSAEARKKGDYFSQSTFGNDKARYSVQDALDLSKDVPAKRIGTKGFVNDQVSKWWQGDLERAKRATPSKEFPILIMKND